MNEDEMRVGHPLTDVPEIPSQVVDALRALDITDAEQVIALGAQETVRAELPAALGVSAEQLGQLIASARAVVPQRRALAFEVPADYDFALGAREPTQDALAVADELPRLEAVEAVEALPPAVNWIKRFDAIRNQAGRGTCVSFAVTALHEFVLQAEGRPQNLSEQHLYYETKAIDGEPNECGTFQAFAVKALATRGQCRESTWPYNPTSGCNDHGPVPAAARAEAAAYKLQTRAIAPHDVLAIKTALAAGSVVPISIPVYDSWYRSAATRSTGRITMRIGNEPMSGGHAVCLVGYQDDAGAPGGGYFILRNSWASWATTSAYAPGYGTIPYQYVANDNWESFTAIPQAAPQELIRVQHDPRVEFLGRGAECWVRFASFSASNLQAATAVDITSLRLRSWQGTRVVDEFVAQPSPGSREVKLTNLRLRANGDRTSWSHRITWEWTYVRRPALVAADGDDDGDAAVSGGELTAEGADGQHNGSRSAPIVIDSDGAGVVIHVGSC